jgi:ketosteroid isomerase-like protein
MSDLEARVVRLEAIEAVRRVFHRYLHAVDLGAAEELIALFSEDCRCELRNFPPGSGKDIDLVGHDQLRSIYGSLRPASYRHHCANASIVVSGDALSAEISSYFLTTVDNGIQGGLYEGRMQLTGEGWLIAWWRVSSQWGWRVDQAPPALRNTLASGAWREGWPPT